MRSKALAIITSLLLLVTACAEVGAQSPSDSTEKKKVEETKEKAAQKQAKTKKADKKAETKESQVGNKAFTWPKTCPVTILGKKAFIPASEAPDGPPEMYDSVWYGTPDLYTMINPDGRSSENRWLGGEKTLWWSEHFSVAGEPEPDIAVTARRLDGKTTYEAIQTTHGMRDDIGDFMLVGVTLPEPGCWELTASYKAASLSYVIWVEPKKG